MPSFAQDNDEYEFLGYRKEDATINNLRQEQSQELKKIYINYTYYEARINCTTSIGMDQQQSSRPTAFPVGG